MSNLIHSDPINNMHMSSYYKKESQDKDDALLDEKTSRLQVNSEQKLSFNQEQEQDKKNNKQVAYESDLTRQNSQNLLDRVADDDAKKAKISAYTQYQQQLLKQVDNAISPSTQASYHLKV